MTKMATITLDELELLHTNLRTVERRADALERLCKKHEERLSIAVTVIKRAEAVADTFDESKNFAKLTHAAQQAFAVRQAGVLVALCEVVDWMRTKPSIEPEGVADAGTTPGQ